MKKLLLCLLAIVLFAPQISKADITPYYTMGNYFTALKNLNFVEESMREAFTEAVWNNASSRIPPNVSLSSNQLTNSAYSLDNMKMTYFYLGGKWWAHIYANMAGMDLTLNGATSKYQYVLVYTLYDYPNQYKALFTHLVEKGVVKSNVSAGTLRYIYENMPTFFSGAPTSPDFNTLTASTTGQGRGTVEMATRHASGTVATAVAKPSSATSTFLGWSGCTTTSGTTCNVLMNTDKTITANFGTTTVASQAPAITSISPTSGATSTSVTITGTGFTPTGNKIKFGELGSENNPAYSKNSSNGTTLTFVVPSGNYLACWSVTPACSAPAYTTTPGQYAVSVINANGTSNAKTFAVTNTSTVFNTLTASTTGQGRGTVEMATRHASGTVATAVAKPSSATSTFLGWSGCTTTSGTTCNVLMNTDKTITANFGTTTVATQTNTASSTLTTSVVGQGNVSVNGVLINDNGVLNKYPKNTVISIKAIPKTSTSTFAWWEGCTSNTAECSLKMDTDKAVTAHFVYSANGVLPTTSAIYKRSLSEYSYSSENLYNNDVKVLQKFLISKGFNTQATGFFGPQTKKALMAYQKSRGIIPPNGNFGPRTRAVVIAETGPLPGVPTSTPSPALPPATPPGTVNNTNTPGVVTAKSCYMFVFNLSGTSPKLEPISCTDKKYLEAHKVYKYENIKTSYALATSTGGAGVGSITGASPTYASGTTATLTAVANNGSQFAGWTGCTSTTNVCSIKMNSPKTVTANFLLLNTNTSTFRLSTSTAGTGVGTITGGIPTYSIVTTVTLTANPGANSIFTGWSGACTNTSGTCSVVTDGNKSVSANFVLREVGTVYHPLTALTSGPGSISGANPTYASGTTAYLTAVPSSNSRFTNWIGACSGTLPSCSVLMNGNKSVTANFASTNSTASVPQTYTISTSVTGSNTSSGLNATPGSISGASGIYLSGQSVTITAVPVVGYAFANWGGDCSGTSLTCTLNMTSQKTVVANFAPIPAPAPATITKCYVYDIASIISGGGKWTEVSCTGSKYLNSPASMRKTTTTTAPTSQAEQINSIANVLESIKEALKNL